MFTEQKSSFDVFLLKQHSEKSIKCDSVQKSWSKFWFYPKQVILLVFNFPI